MTEVKLTPEGTLWVVADPERALDGFPGATTISRERGRGKIVSEPEGPSASLRDAAARCSCGRRVPAGERVSGCVLDGDYAVSERYYTDTYTGVHIRGVWGERPRFSAKAPPFQRKSSWGERPRFSAKAPPFQRKGNPSPRNQIGQRAPVSAQV
jgi:hypothetical protein